MKGTGIALTRDLVLALLCLPVIFLFAGTGRTAWAQHASHEPAIQDAGEADSEDVPIVEVSPEKQKLIGLRTVEVKERQMQKTIRTVGRVEYDERRLMEVNNKFEGWIEKLHVDYTGRRVNRGDALAELYSPELVATQQEFINVLKWSQAVEKKPESADTGNNIRTMLSKDAELIVDAARQRLRFWDISEQQIGEIKNTGTPFRTLTVYSPADGFVIEKAALQGMKAMPGQRLFVIADISTLWVIADIYEYELSFIREGQAAKITMSYFPGREFTSSIDYIYPSLTDRARTASVRFQMPNPGLKLKPGMFANIEIRTGSGSRLAVPDDAVIDTGARTVVYVDRGGGEFEPREVKLGLRAGGFREVLAGLKAGERVAGSAVFLVDSEAQLTGVTPLSGHEH